VESRRGVYKYLHITATLTKIIVLSLSCILSILLPARSMDTRFLRHALSSHEPSPPSIDHRARNRVEGDIEEVVGSGVEGVVPYLEPKGQR
jgi:hypothetical protein